MPHGQPLSFFSVCSLMCFRTCCLSNANEQNPKANQRDAEPAPGLDALAKQEFAAKRAQNVAESRYGHDEADVFPGKQHQQREERNRHQGKAEPHPAAAEGAQDHAQQMVRIETLHLADALHCMRDGQLAACSAENHDEKKCGVAPGHLSSVVRGEVPPTSSTPMQITSTPIHRIHGTTSPRSR